ncbi:MAG: SAM-dependent methyltransferase [Deltaproteobacteria bacterium HGW-Deltaproteobacteria-6]|nr:MAG: SAM-dependent methyltransferase [Deltaproteobacteria bacterium HGW-Deltaproteobacteria-6]
MTESRDNTSNDKIPSNTEVFADYAGYYDLLYRDKNYETEAEYVSGLIQKFHPAAQSILELGSGTGKHACSLAERGYKIHGIERSPEMLGQSQSSAIKRNMADGRLSFSAGDIRKVRLREHYDAVISLFHVMSYQTANEDVTAAFDTARHHLKPGGIFIFDVWYGPAVLTERPEVRIKRMADGKIEITRLAEPVLHPNENRVDVNYNMLVRNLASQTVFELKETHTMRYFFKPEIDLWATLSGFTVQAAEEWQTAKPIGIDTWSVCFCLKAR